MVSLEVFLGLIVVFVIAYAVWALISINRATFWPPVDDVDEFADRAAAFRKITNEEHRPL